MQQKKIAYLLILPLCVLLGALTVYPFIYALIVSMSSRYLADPSSHRFIGLQNYISMVKDVRFINAMKNTFVYTGLAVSVEFFIGFSVALLLNREFRGRAVIRVLFLLPMIATPAPIAMVWRQIYDPTLGVANYFLSLLGFKPLAWTNATNTALLSVNLVNIWQWTPFFILTLSAGLASLPKDPVEAARIDGASNIDIICYIIVPLLKSLILIVLIFRIMDALRAYDLIYVLTEGGPGVATETLNYYAYLTSFRWLRMGYGSAIAMILLFISLSIGMRLSKYIIEK